MSFDLTGFARYEADAGVNQTAPAALNGADQTVDINDDANLTTINVGDTVDLSPGGIDRVYLGTTNVNGNDLPVFEVAGGDFLVGIPDFITPEPVIADFPATLSAAEITAESLDLLCFAGDTIVNTHDGEMNVSELKIGDSVLTTNGNYAPVLWVGVHKVSLRFSRNNDRLLPVTLTAGSLGDNVPNEDLTVSNDHAFLVDGILATAGSMVNDTSIFRVPASAFEEDTITYYHIETENHELILANNAPAETFIDNASRSTFDNFQDYVDLYGEERAMDELPMARAMSPRQLPKSIKARLEQRAVELGHAKVSVA